MYLIRAFLFYHFYSNFAHLEYEICYFILLIPIFLPSIPIIKAYFHYIINYATFSHSVLFHSDSLHFLLSLYYDFTKYDIYYLMWFVQKRILYLLSLNITPYYSIISYISQYRFCVCPFFIGLSHSLFVYISLPSYPYPVYAVLLS